MECAWPVAAVLGEGPMWSPDGTLWFVDIKGQRIHAFEEASGATRSFTTPEYAAFVFRDARGGLICGLRSGLHRFDPATGQFSRVATVDAAHPSNRLNDGFVDAQGRLWFGTMDNEERASSGSLYRFARDRLERMDGGYVITNGPAMSPDGKVLYHVDTQQCCVHAFDVDTRGALSGKRLFLQLTEPDVYPDGPAVDGAGNVWVAMFGGWAVRCYSPQGDFIRSIDLPVSQCTKAAFGGPDLRTLYITTATVGLSDAQLARQPLAGGLFRARVDIAGLVANEFAG
ncbi:MAG: SMP-30/gluconolactonase/LRE family protein [Pseudomonadota bacterium]